MWEDIVPLAAENLKLFLAGKFDEMRNPVAR
jgi:hypothetical protein